MLRHLLAIAVILTAATGCDNVGWGGVEMELRPPPPTTAEEPADSAQAGDEPATRSYGTVLLAGLRDGSRATLRVVGQIAGDAIAPFPDPAFPEDSAHLSEVSAVGSVWTLFSEGVRVGSLTVDATGVAEQFCPVRATVSGVVELVPPASEAERLLAVPAAAAEGREYGEFALHSHVYDQRVASLSLATAAIPRLGARFPPDGVLAARRDIQAFALEGVPGEAIAATFLYQDELAVVPPGPRAYALFLLGIPAGDEYREAFTWYRAVDTDGKGAPAYFNHLDLDGDGVGEILLDVFGSSRRWHAGLARRDGQWVRSFQDACTSGPSS